jgi:tetratricopeptide (TPR) repeat protein
MEYVEGRSISEHCEANQLTINERLKLFRQVCAAVQFAHQKLVAHRDLKPSNVLVTKDGAKLLDFGIAKLLAPDPSFGAITQTETALRAMTPEYASPEQARGLTITAATDIYSLGVVLYELLTNRRPHQFKTYSPAEIERAICDTAPARPSEAVSHKTDSPTRLARQLAGDLDNIIMMAMRKEPERRYQSVEQFSEDIRRHLEGLPVIARPDTFRYRAGKFIHRHRLVLAALTIVLLSLLGGIIATTRAARIAQAERERAERRFMQIRKLSNSFLFEFHDKIRNLPGSTEAREMVVRKALEYLDSLAQEAAGDATLEAELAVAYQKVGDVQGDPWTPNLGHTAAAMTSYRKSLSLAEQLVARGHADLKMRRMLAEDYFKLGALLSESGDKLAAQTTLRQGVGIAEAVEKQTGKEDDFRLLMNFHVRIGNTRLDTGDAIGGLESYRQAQQVAERCVAAFPTHDARYSLAVANNHVGEGLLVKGDLVGAIEQYRRSESIDQELVKELPANLTYRRHLQITYGWLGGLLGNSRYINLGDRANARKYYEKALAIAEELAAADPKNARAQLDLAICYGMLGSLLTDSDPARAAANYHRGLAVLRGLLAVSPDEFSYLRRQAGQFRGLAEAQRALGDRQGALKNLRQAQAIWQTLMTRDPANLDGSAGQHATLLSLAELLQEMGDDDAAMEYSRQALTLAEQEALARSTNLYARWRLADSYSGLGKLYGALAAAPKIPPEQRQAHRREACAWRRKALEVWDSWNQYGVSSVFNTTKRELAARALAQCDAAF